MTNILLITSEFTDTQLRQYLPDAVIDTGKDEHSIRRRIDQQGYDVIILEATIANVDAWGLLRYIRSVSDMPLMFIVHDGINDTLSALSLGADDCVTQNTNVHVLIARIRALLRRTGTASAQV